jgi:hypothetical protein
MAKTVASPANSDVRPSDRRGESPSVRRADGGHLLAHVGKNTATNPKLRQDSDLIFQRRGAGAQWPPVQGDKR